MSFERRKGENNFLNLSTSERNLRKSADLLELYNDEFDNYTGPTYRKANAITLMLS